MCICIRQLTNYFSTSVFTFLAMFMIYK